jgi:hypothetical protein
MILYSQSSLQDTLLRFRQSSNHLVYSIVIRSVRLTKYVRQVCLEHQV